MIRKNTFNKKLLVFGFLGLNALLTFDAMAIIVGGQVTGGGALSQGGTFIDFGPAPSGLVVGNDTFQDPNLYGFDEDQNIFLTSDLNIDVGGSVIGAGTQVASHYVFFDPGPGTTITGWVDFDSDILGIITSTPNLLASDFLLNNDVTYLNPGLRGLEAGDTAWIDATFSNRLNLSLFASTPGDYVRVLTAFSSGAAVPVPAAAWLFATALIGLAGIGRHRKTV